jgi:hypothetical protein
MRTLSQPEGTAQDAVGSLASVNSAQKQHAEWNNTILEWADREKQHICQVLNA